MSYQKVCTTYAKPNINTEPMSFPDFVGRSYFDFTNYILRHKDPKVMGLFLQSIFDGDALPPDTCHWRVLVHIDRKGEIKSVPMTG